MYFGSASTSKSVSILFVGYYSLYAHFVQVTKIMTIDRLHFKAVLGICEISLFRKNSRQCMSYKKE